MFFNNETFFNVALLKLFSYVHTCLLEIKVIPEASLVVKDSSIFDACFLDLDLDYFRSEFLRSERSS